MKKYLFSTLLAAALLLAGCSKEAGTRDSVGWSVCGRGGPLKTILPLDGVSGEPLRYQRDIESVHSQHLSHMHRHMIFRPLVRLVVLIELDQLILCYAVQSQLDLHACAANV